MPSSSAASTTARLSSTPMRQPKLFVPRPTTETSGPLAPSWRLRTMRNPTRRERPRPAPPAPLPAVGRGRDRRGGGGGAAEREAPAAGALAPDASDLGPLGAGEPSHDPL